MKSRDNFNFNNEEVSVLIVDDKPANLELMESFLTGKGINTAIAKNGESAIKRAKLVQPKLILLDVRMPGIDGFEVCRRLKRISILKDIPVIFMSALDEVVDKVKGFEVGGVDFITKPINNNEMWARVNLHLEIYHLRRELEKKTERLNESLQIAKMGQWEFDLIKNKLLWSDEIFAIFELDKVTFEPSYEAFLNTIHPEDRDLVSKAYETSLAERSIYDIEHRLLMKDGRVKFVREICRTEYDESDKPLYSIGTVQDITVAKEAEIRLAEEKERAELASRAKSDFLANMSHEIRTPMNAVLGFADILKKKETDPKKKKYVENIYTSGHALLNLINDILDLSKIESGKLELQYSPVSLFSLFEEMRVVFERKIMDKGLNFNIKLDEDVPLYLILDKIRLRQIIVNLISNAVKFTDDGSIDVLASVKYDEDSMHSSVILTVKIKDTGIGIPESEQEKIFGAFEQMKNQLSERFGGTGLGLAITRRLVEMMGGKITVKSEFGEGSVFTVAIPNIEIAAAYIEQKEKSSEIDYDSIIFEPAKILIADDIDYNRELLTNFINFWDFNIVYAENGEEAIEQAVNEMPDIILLDMKMPVVSGYEAAERLYANKKTKDIPIIAITASALTQDENAISKICTDYLRKPVGRSDVVNKLIKYLPHTLKEVSKVDSFTVEVGIITEGLSTDVLQEIFNHSRMGDVVGLETVLNKVRAGDAKYEGFCTQIEKLADNYEWETILRFIEGVLSSN